MNDILEIDTTLSTGSAGDWYEIPVGFRGISYTIIPTAGSGKLQYTTDTRANVKSGAAIANDAPEGLVTAQYADWMHGEVTAIRLYRVTGTVRLIATCR